MAISQQNAVRESTGSRTYELPVAITESPTSLEVRENLVEILRQQMLGPIWGEEEVLNFRDQPDSIYMLGRIAPVKLGDSSKSQDVPDTDLIDDDEVPTGSSFDVQPDAQGEDASSDEDRPIKGGNMVPTVMGLRIQVSDSTPSITVRADWATYDRTKNEVETGKDGSVRYDWKRTQHSAPAQVKFSEIAAGVTKYYVLKDAVTLSVDVYEDPERGRKLVEIALYNDTESGERVKTKDWLYQTKLTLESVDEAAFLPVVDPLEPAHLQGLNSEEEQLLLQYRDKLEYAVGRTCSVGWSENAETRRARRVWTEWMPVAETPQTAARVIEGAELDMVKLVALASEAVVSGDTVALESSLRPIAREYEDWLVAQETESRTLPAHLQIAAELSLEKARLVLGNLNEGIDYLVTQGDDKRALKSFAFMNRSMADQRIHSQVSELRARNESLSLEDARAQVLDPDGINENGRAHSWRAFQLAFILMQIKSMCEPSSARRSSDSAFVELLFFPTGGGKTEAYLGLAAFTFAIRRLDGIVGQGDDAVDGRDGVAVLMRYTLRLLTSQQFQRATTLICAAERIRREDPDTWGDVPFRIGLWVGSAVTPKYIKDVRSQLDEVAEGRGHRLTALQIRRCPWCGESIRPEQDAVLDEERSRLYVYCPNERDECPFARYDNGLEVSEGIPVLSVDEEIYRLTPAFVIATVDKFARLAREGQAAALFGQVTSRCTRHGYSHPDGTCSMAPGSKHPKKGSMQAATVLSAGRLRPPDLIIQDELHLITGALGTTVGLFEAGIDIMSSWEDAEGKRCAPLIVASSATVRNAHAQVKGIYGRNTSIFPPQVLNVRDTFFSTEVEVTESDPGRKYLGVSAAGVRTTNVEIRLADIMLTAGQYLMDKAGEAADPYMTMVAYFNATRELAGMSRYMSDDVQTAVRARRPWKGLPVRLGTSFRKLNVGELTSRVSSGDITTTLDQLAEKFTERHDTTDGHQAWMDDRNIEKAQIAAKTKPSERAKRKIEDRSGEPPFDAMLATSMLQVGVDVTRLGLMMVVGQPKNTAEYIQASSRVGRDARRPGLVVTLLNWARPRDLSHYEQFKHYHETFYSKVEALSVTPTSPTSLERGIEGLFVSTLRVLSARMPQGSTINPEDSASNFPSVDTYVEAVIDELVERLEARGANEQEVRGLLHARRDAWLQRVSEARDRSRYLVYDRATNPEAMEPLMGSPENLTSETNAGPQAVFRVPNSMREVQPEIELLMPVNTDDMYLTPPEGAPRWTFVPTEGGSK